MGLRITSWEEIKEFAESEGVGETRLIRDIKKCEAHGTEWKLVDKGDGKIKIVIKKDEDKKDKTKKSSK